MNDWRRVNVWVVTGNRTLDIQQKENIACKFFSAKNRRDYRIQVIFHFYFYSIEHVFLFIYKFCILVFSLASLFVNLAFF